MNEQKAKRKTQPRRGALFGAASCGAGVRGIQDANRPAGASADRHRHAARRWQCQQRAFTGVLAVHGERSRVDIKGHHYARPEHPGRSRAHIPNTAGPSAKSNKLVCRHMGAVDSPSRYGLWAPSIAARRVHKMACLKQIVLPDYRAKAHPYRTDYRARAGSPRTDYRSCYAKKRRFLGPIIGLLLDMPSVVTISYPQSNGESYAIC